MQKRSSWFDLRFRGAGMLAFMIHRISGIGLVAYLFLHLALLNQLRQGPGAWNGFVQVMRSPLVLFLDGVLLFGILIHGLNGLRLTLVGLGILVQHQRPLFWACLGLAIVLSTVGTMAMK
jgi:succinate dehydrogenase / fumarate reductase, cytochrome b subunit